MKPIALLPLSLLFAVAVFAAHEGAQQPVPVVHGEMKSFTPDKIEWQDAGALPPGAKIALLEGDLKNGPFTFQIKIPAGYTLPPHRHPNIEHVTVLSGGFKLGMGEKFDDAKLQEFPAGSFLYMPAHMAHFGRTDAETIIQIHGTAPWEIIYINPVDDPRKKV